MASADFTLTVVAGHKPPDDISVEMIASAIARRGTKTKTEQLTVAPEAWIVDEVYHAAPPG